MVTTLLSFLRSSLVGLLISLFISGVVCILFFQWMAGYVFERGRTLNQHFVDTAGRSPVSIFFEVGSGFLSASSEETTPTRWLILGTDEVAESGRQAVLTDTMIFASYHPQTNDVSLLSLPRDLYHPGYATKINALYFYGRERSPLAPQEFTTQVLEEMLGVPFDGVLVISLADVEELIDLVGGVYIDVPHTFTDEEFPRSGVDVSVETDPAVLYQTVTFEAGEQYMDGETALQYIRTRKSADPEEGTDEARTRRQRQVLSALFAQMTDPYFIANPYNTGRLYRWYADRYNTEVSLHEFGKMMGHVAENGTIPEVVSLDLPVTSAAQATDSGTLFVHPPVETYGQWVYEPVDPSWDQLHDYVREQGL